MHIVLEFNECFVDSLCMNSYITVTSINIIPHIMKNSRKHDHCYIAGCLYLVKRVGIFFFFVSKTKSHLGAPMKFEIINL